MRSDKKLCRREIGIPQPLSDQIQLNNGRSRFLPGGGGGGGGGVLIGIFGRGVPPASPHPDPISDQKMPFSTPVFRQDLKNPYPLLDLTLHSICISAERKST